MGWEALVFPLLEAGDTIVINSAGLFIYAGVPAAGSLAIAITPASGTDQFGNSYGGGFDSFDASGDDTAIDGSVLVFTNRRSVTMTRVIFTPNGDGTGIQVQSTGTGPADVEFDLPVIFNQPVSELTAAEPETSIFTPETWHSMGLLNGWANAAGNVTAQYQYVVSPPDCVELIGTLNANAATAATFFTLPAGYRPVSQQQFACGATGGQVAGSTPFIQCDASGNLTVQHDTIGAADAYVFHGLISLTA
jgi:hypothetical protein